MKAKTYMSIEEADAFYTKGQKPAEFPIAYVEDLMRQDPSGIGCHHCGSDNVFEYNEVSPLDLTTVINTLYICQACFKSWSFKVTRR